MSDLKKAYQQGLSNLWSEPITDTEVTFGIGKSKHLTPELANKIVDEDPSWWKGHTHVYLAANKHAPDESIQRLAKKTKDADVAYVLSKNSKLSSDSIDHMVKRAKAGGYGGNFENNQILREIYKHPNLQGHTITSALKTLNHADGQVIFHPNTTPEHMDALSKHPYEEVRRKVAMSDKTSVHTLDKLKTDKEPYVVHGLITNEKTPDESLKHIYMNPAHPAHIRHLAERTLLDRKKNG